MTLIISVTLLTATIIPLSKCDLLEHNLYTRLLRTYDTLERPNKNISAAVDVYLGITLQQLIAVDEKNQIITMNAWLKYTWNDYRIKWNAEENDGMIDLRFPMASLWKPDVLLYNSVDSSFDSTYPANFVAYYDGTINWIPPGIFMISCKIDITWFPFDEQRCHFKFGSWTYDGTKLDLKPDQVQPVDMSEYIVSSEWDLYKVAVSRDVKYYDCCPEPYFDVKFYIFMKRRTLYYIFNLIVPCITITIMTIVGFMLPVDCGEKISLRTSLLPFYFSLLHLRNWHPIWQLEFHGKITVVLSIVFFLSIVSSMVPATSESVPLLGTFFSMCMIASSLTTAMTVFVVMLHHRTPDSHHMGEMEYICTPRSTKDPSETSLEQRISACCERLAKDGALESCQKDGKRIYDTAMLMLTQRMFTQIKYMTRRFEQQDTQSEMNTDWNYAAMVLDRFCLFVFTGIILFGTLYIFATAPYLTADNIITEVDVINT